MDHGTCSSRLLAHQLSSLTWDIVPSLTAVSGVGNTPLVLMASPCVLLKVQMQLVSDAQMQVEGKVCLIGMLLPYIQLIYGKQKCSTILMNKTQIYHYMVA